METLIIENYSGFLWLVFVIMVDGRNMKLQHLRGNGVEASRQRYRKNFGIWMFSSE